MNYNESLSLVYIIVFGIFIVDIVVAIFDKIKNKEVSTYKILVAVLALLFIIKSI